MLKPILFNTDMVRAILDGRKTQTRRVCKGQPQDGVTSPEMLGYKAPYSHGDTLWVRETWCNLPVSSGNHARLMRGRYYYKADDPDIRPDGWRGNWRPSIHMPKEAARIFLRVKTVRMEQLQEITEKDVRSEGCVDQYIGFSELWDSTIRKGDLAQFGWKANPWVWVIEFERAEEPEFIEYRERGAARK